MKFIKLVRAARLHLTNAVIASAVVMGLISFSPAIAQTKGTATATATASTAPKPTPTQAPPPAAAPVPVPVPKIVVKKTVSQNPLQAGKLGQFYTIEITVLNGGSTATSIAIQDDLPSGITTSGSISVSSGTLTACTFPAGSTSISGCTLSGPLASGVYKITVPVNVNATAPSGKNNVRVISSWPNSTCNSPSTFGAPCNDDTGNVSIMNLTLSVSKAASANHFSVGKPNQFYTIKIYVANGTTTSPIIISDSLPAGITLAGSPTSNSSALTGCPNSGGTLSGCQFNAPLATGNYTVTVPVSVSSVAPASVTNTVQVSSLGTNCLPSTTTAPCRSTTQSIGVFDAVNDAVSHVSGLVRVFNLATNDKYVAGNYQYSLAPGSTCAGAAVSSLGLGSYTTPAAGTTCTVNYQLCSPMPNAVCDTATLTVTGLAIPTLSVNKTASANHFAKGKPNQFYTITVTVANGPTTNPITISDSLPMGVTLSGTPTSSSGTLSGCPSSGSSILCQLNGPVANGTYTITLPVNTTNAASNIATNTVNVSSTDSNCLFITPCKSTTSPVSVFKAVDEGTTNPSLIAGSSSTYNVALNDLFVVGVYQYSMATGSSCANAAISPAGISTFTVPAAGTTCTVNYQLCSPMLNAVCDTATLTVTGGLAGTALSVTKTASANIFVVDKPNQFYTITVTVANGATTSPILISDSLPAGITLASSPTSNSSALTGCPTSGGTLSGCQLNAPLANGTYTITVPVNVSTAAAASATNTVKISSLGTKCLPSSTLAACTSTTPAIGVLDAINDVASQAGGTIGTKNVEANDKGPSGSTFSLAPGSTCQGASVSSTGVASYTAPYANATCTVNYQLCAPAPNSSVCDTATLTVTGTGVASTNYTVGLTVVGLPDGATVSLQNNGSDNLSVIKNGTYTFTNPVTGAYAVTANTTTPGVTCTVANGAGTATSNVSNITVTCSGRFTLLTQTATSNYPATDCMKDTVTGLIWEGKTTSGARSNTIQLTNFDNTNLLQNQLINTQPAVQPTAAQIADSTNSVGYLNAINQTPLCGFTGDWRIPSDAELVVLSNAMGLPSSPIATFWAPNTKSLYLSSTTFSAAPTLQKFAMGKNFMTPSSASYNYGRNVLYYIRLVR